MTFCNTDTDIDLNSINTELNWIEEWLFISFFITDYNALLAGLPASSIKPLPLIQNAAARYIFNELKRTHVTPLFINLHGLPKAARIKFKALMFAYRRNHLWLCTPLPKFITSDVYVL